MNCDVFNKRKGGMEGRKKERKGKKEGPLESRQKKDDFRKRGNELYGDLNLP